MRRVLIVVLSWSLVLGGCGVRQPLNPPRLVTADQTDMSIQLFMQATLLLAHYYHFPTAQYSQIQAQAVSAGFSALPFMPPETVPATPPLLGLVNSLGDDPQGLDQLADYVVKKYGYKPLVKYYIRTGLRASQMICRNYLLRLEENNRYLEFLRKELGVGYTLATAVLLATHANQTLTNSFAIAHNFTDGTITAYEEYRFLSVDREAARVLVETAQDKFGEYYMQKVDAGSPSSNDTQGGFTFSDAINAVSVIEYQCTREGIQALLTRSINNTPTNMTIDAATGTVIFRSSQMVDPMMPRPPAPPSTVTPPIPGPDTVVNTPVFVPTPRGGGSGVGGGSGGGVGGQPKTSPAGGGGGQSKTGQVGGTTSTTPPIDKPGGIANPASGLERRITFTKAYGIQAALCFPPPENPTVPADFDKDMFQATPTSTRDGIAAIFTACGLDQVGVIKNGGQSNAMDALRGFKSNVQASKAPPCPEPLDANNLTAYWKELGASLKKANSCKPSR